MCVSEHKSENFIRKKNKEYVFLVKISVIIPTLNEEKYIGKTLESLKNQIIGGDEIIVVDSFSKDKTVEISRKFSSKVVYFPRCGIGPAKTFGAQKAKNEVIAFLDADGVPSNEWLDRVRDTFRNNEIESIAGLGLYSSVSKKREIMYNIFARVIFILGIINYSLTKTPWMPVNNCAIRKDVFLKYGGLHNIVCEDYDFALRAKGIKNVYDRGMRVLLSDRRFEKNGFLRTIGLWTRSVIAILRNKNKIAATEYNVIR
jgi:glycosyltransferase involved in cell wall biosynthesis